MKKRGQFFLIAAIVIVAVVIGLGNRYSLIESFDEDVQVYDLSKEIDFELSQVLFDGTAAGVLQEDLEEQIKGLTAFYAKANPDKDLAIYFGNEEEVNAIFYEAEKCGEELALDEATSPLTGGIVEDCVENWECSGWNACTNNGFRYRRCYDANGCGTTYNKPVSVETCTPPCTESWTCGDWSSCNQGARTRSCSDSNSCGTTSNKPATSESCTSPEETTTSGGTTTSGSGGTTTSGGGGTTGGGTTTSGNASINGTVGNVTTATTNATISTNDTTGGATGVSSGAGSGGEGGICTESWTCTLWEECSNGGQQMRACSDSNSCGTELNKPALTRNCTAEQKLELKKGETIVLEKRAEEAAPLPAGGVPSDEEKALKILEFKAEGVARISTNESAEIDSVSVKLLEIKEVEVEEPRAEESGGGGGGKKKVALLELRAGDNVILEEIGDNDKERVGNYEIGVGSLLGEDAEIDIMTAESVERAEEIITSPEEGFVCFDYVGTPGTSDIEIKGRRIREGKVEIENIGEEKKVKLLMIKKISGEEEFAFDFTLRQGQNFFVVVKKERGAGRTVSKS